MTALTPEQIRALADEHDDEAREYVLDKAEKEGQPEYGDVYEYEDRIVWHRNTAVALRAAADQLEAVTEWRESGQCGGRSYAALGRILNGESDD